jgi:hypothetical protein
MSYFEDSLGTLVMDIAREVPPHSSTGRTRLEAILLPIVRVAMRTGHGPAPLVLWVRQQIQSGVCGGNFDRVAQHLAQVISDRILDRFSPAGGHETVIGW